MAALPAPETSSSTRFESVLEAVRAAILAGEFEPGERLHEVKLTTLLGVSRTPVRAALQKLASEGLLDYTPNRGYTLREFSIDEVISAYEVRAVLEGLAARLSAERGLNVSEIGTLQQALRDGDDLLRNGQITDEHRSEYSRINAYFHVTIHASAGSRLLNDMVYLCQQVPVSSPRNVVAFEEGDVRRRHEDHHRIFEAIVGREPWRAEMLMRDHVASVKSSLIRSLASPAAVQAATKTARRLRR
ncbi:GntR family transcriptional regulator [Bradyrhizobium sp. CCBAU 51765]|uniref:GntR family transcriptional regulator n=1 Tax=Bradyrhizobium sp. CCBAU 51765 TaxID=1325102 RepID=UPI001886E035|nr:GntR family transcriptional regulator [Bradyrhizobium sp. CCBAU 51765]QOZ08058.1 GntR family transcriptional regulator [Bradyrhizobium sp. CCBAU 51765]